MRGTSFRVRPDASGTNDSPLLASGQTVTNGAGGVSFLFGENSDLFVEALSNGTATLTYAYAGTGDAAGLNCSASLKMTEVKPDIVLTGDYSYLPIRPVFDGTAGKKWVVATFPESQQTNIIFGVRLLGKEAVQRFCL